MKLHRISAWKYIHRQIDGSIIIYHESSLNNDLRASLKLDRSELEMIAKITNQPINEDETD